MRLSGTFDLGVASSFRRGPWHAERVPVSRIRALHCGGFIPSSPAPPIDPPLVPKAWETSIQTPKTELPQSFHSTTGTITWGRRSLFYSILFLLKSALWIFFFLQPERETFISPLSLSAPALAALHLSWLPENSVHDRERLVI